MKEIPMEVNGKWVFPETDVSYEACDMISTTYIECTTGETIKDAISTSMNQSVRNRSLPWWEILVIHNTASVDSVSNKGGSSTESLVMFRMDHALGDGMAIGRLFATCLTNVQGQPVQNMVPISMMRRKVNSRWSQKLLMVSRCLYSFMIVNLNIFGGYDDDVFFHTRQRNDKGVVSTFVMEKLSR